MSVRTVPEVSCGRAGPTTPDGTWQMQINVLDGYPGYHRTQPEVGTPMRMANFLHEGATLEQADLVRADEATVASLTEAVGWVVARFLDDPSTYRDEGRPAQVVGEPIWS